MTFSKRIIAFLLSAVLLAGSIPVRVFDANNGYLGVAFILLDGQRLYDDDSAKSEVLAVTHENDCVLIIKEVSKKWYQVEYNGKVGYMYAGCLDVQKDISVELGLGVVTTAAKLRSGPGTEYTQISSGSTKDELYIIGFKDDWFEVLYTDKQNNKATAYIYSKYLSLKGIPYQNLDTLIQPSYFYCGKTVGEIDFIKTEPELDPSYIPEAKRNTDIDYDRYYKLNQGSLLANASQFKGVPYVYGGKSPSGFDCSGLVYFSMGLMGRSIARSAAGQFHAGYAVDRDELIPGDLVFFGTDGNITHVGIYAGGGRMIHASSSKNKVCSASVSSVANYAGARRVS